MKFNRSAGIILHPSSLPGPDGIGDLGPEAYQWVKFLKDTGCSLWQVLPLGPTGYGDSPYQCFSAFAGNPYLISPTLLMEDGLLNREDLLDRPSFPESFVPFGDAINWKLKVIDRAFERFLKKSQSPLQKSLSIFQNAQSEWLDDFSLFMAIKEVNGGGSWAQWPDPLRKREPHALIEFRKDHKEVIERHIFRQFIFFRQWEALHQYAKQNNIRIIGDAPIYVSFDSADAWSHPDLFYMDEERHLTVVAGVPPDYFSPTGQLWGNPIYRWDIHKSTGYAWWIQRMKATLQLFDIIRLDHFRGFAGYWEVDAASTTAQKGKWVVGPGKPFFDAIIKKLGDLPIIAEDLGEITPDVIELRDKLNLPGMKVLQFAFGDTPKNLFLPHHYLPNCVAYTGTHDNDTAKGWFENTSGEKERQFCLKYLDSNGNNISWDFIRAIWGSVALVALAPLQDFLCLGGEARQNFPGKASGNWSWRYPSPAINKQLLQNIQELNTLYSR